MLFKLVKQALTTYKLEGIRAAFEHNYVRLPLRQNVGPLTCILTQVGSGSKQLAVYEEDIVDALFKVDVFKNTAFLRFYLDELEVPLAYPVKDEMIVELHKSMSTHLSDGCLSTTRLAAGNLGCLYSTALPLKSLSKKGLQQAFFRAYDGLTSPECIALLSQYNDRYDQMFDSLSGPDAEEMLFEDDEI